MEVEDYLGTSDLSPPRERLTIEKLSAVTLTAAAIKRHISAGTWQTHLPGEHSLCGVLQISRQTLRGALKSLQNEGLLLIQNGQRTRILDASAKVRKSATKTIRVMSPVSTREFIPFIAAHLDEFRQLLKQKDFDLKVHQPNHLYRRFSKKALHSYLTEFPADLWVVFSGTPALQRGFMEMNQPAVLAGTPHPEIQLPFVDVHYRAAARHAAGLLKKAGHQRILFLCPDAEFAGDRTCIQGIEAALVHSSTQLDIIRYSADPQNLFGKLAHRLQGESSATAIIASNAVIVPGIFSILLSLQKRIPEDLSLVTLQAAPFFNFLTPAISHYDADALAYAKKLVRLSLAVIQGKALQPEAHWLMPTFFPGKSVAAPRTPPAQRTLK